MNAATSPDPVDLLLCAAVPAELRPFGELLGLEPHVGECRTGRHDGRTVGLLVAGIGRRGDGPLRESLARQRPDAVINVGVAGSLDPELPAGVVVLVGRWHDPEPPHGVVARADEALLRRLAGQLDAAGVLHLEGAALTVDEPLQDTARRDRLHAATVALVVEMEGAAWARACAAAGVPFAGLRVVSDHADRDLPDEAIRLMDRDRLLTPEGEPRLSVPGGIGAGTAEGDPATGGGAEVGDELERFRRALREAGRKWASANEALERTATALLPRA